MRRQVYTTLAAAALALSSEAAMAAPTLLIDGSGTLTGATGVSIGDRLFDVSFVGGTCNDVFAASCPAAQTNSNVAASYGNATPVMSQTAPMYNSFQFTTAGDALAAARALIDQIDTSGVGAIAGCDSTECGVLTPYAADSRTFGASVAPFNSQVGAVFTDIFPLEFNTNDFGGNTFAVFAEVKGSKNFHTFYSFLVYRALGYIFHPAECITPFI